MRVVRRAAAVATVTGLLLTGLPGAALATHVGDVDCADFRYQQDAQAWLDRHPGDPDGLDADRDGLACESLPRGAAQPAPLPVPLPAPLPAPAPVPVPQQPTPQRFAVVGAIAERYLSLGGPAGFLGQPLTEETGTVDGGRYSLFSGGAIYWTPSTGAWETHGGIRQAWAGLGAEFSVLGFPTSNELRTPTRPGAANYFQGGMIYWSAATGAHELHGAILDAWRASGWENGRLGFPVTDERPTGDGGAYNDFQGGSLYWSPATGAQPVEGAIRDAWLGVGGPASSLGFPTTAEYDIAGGRQSDFQGGRISWTPAGGTQVLAPAGPPVPDALLPVVSGNAADVLATLAVKGRAPEDRVRPRGQFGPAWADVDRNGCDTRNDILQRDLIGATFKRRAPATAWCATGVLDDPYTGTRIAFTRGRPTSGEVQIDHVVALSDAWQKGAQQLVEPQAAGVRQRPAQPARRRRADSTSRRATATPPPGCRPTARSGAATSPGRSR